MPIMNDFDYAEVKLIIVMCVTYSVLNVPLCGCLAYSAHSNVLAVPFVSFVQSYLFEATDVSGVEGSTFVLDGGFF